MRNSSLDLIRCIAIILVICIHSMGMLKTAINPLEINTNHIIYAFLSSITEMGVPLFVMLSGALLLKKEENPRSFLKKRLKRIMIPFFIWSIIIFSLDKFVTHQSLSIMDFIQKFLTHGIHGTYWYIYMLLGLYLLTPILQKVFNKISTSLLVYIFLLTIICAICSTFHNSHQNSDFLLLNYIFPYMHFLAYFICGHIIYSHFISFEKLNRISFIGFIICFIISFINTLYTFGKFPFTFFESLFFFSFLISRHKAKQNTNPFVEFISLSSYGIYLSHILFISLIYKTELLNHIPIFTTPFVLVISIIIFESILFFIIQKMNLTKILS